MTSTEKEKIDGRNINIYVKMKLNFVFDIYFCPFYYFSVSCDCVTYAFDVLSKLKIF